MIEINKIIDERDYYTFTIKTNEGEFKISFEGTLDLYWWYFPNGSVLDAPNKHSFYITKENIVLFNLFDVLYDSIISAEPYRGIDSLSDMKKDFSNLETKKRLVDNNIICWHSDDFVYEEASVLYIEKLNEDNYKITFEKSKNDMFSAFSIRIRNSGSRYHPYNIPFMFMYKSLKEYNTEYHQISIEEYEYTRKLKNKC